jgi:acetyl-CoA carboxylase biotin carboxyl carrier protein
MVGTAYLSSEPGSKPFVSPGDSVKAGDTLLIVEAMKVMNPIAAPAGGTVVQVLVTDGQPVEFDQPLVVLG